MKAQYIEAVSKEFMHYPSVFLGGGITNCPDWQKEITALLQDEEITILNPRRENFPLDDPEAAKEQIEWEFHALGAADVFSMWFSGEDSVQPICMYELGRHLALRDGDLETVVIGVDPDYKRAQDVYIQVGLVDENLAHLISRNLKDHALRIKKTIKHLEDDQSDYPDEREMYTDIKALEKYKSDNPGNWMPADDPKYLLRGWVRVVGVEGEEKLDRVYIKLSDLYRTQHKKD